MWTRSLTYQNNVSFFLFGPRGTGKTSWIKTRFGEAAYFDLLDDAVYATLVAHPENLDALARAKTKGTRIILDEVQKLPQVLDEVHRLIETKKWTFTLTGSSARKLKRSGANLLAGRARTLEMYPLSPEELGNDFNFAHALKYGLLPSVWVEKDPEHYLKSYVGTYLRHEVEEESLVRNIGMFAKFLEAASFSQAGVLNIQTVAKDCGIKRKTVENHFDLIEELLLSTRLDVFQRKAKRKLSAHPKFFFFDTGVFRSLRPRGPLDLTEEIEGAALETLVLQTMLAVNANLNLGYSFHYWRTQDKHEVDFILYGERGLLAVEVKRSNRFRESDLTALRLFLDDYPSAKALFLYAGTESLEFERIRVLPLVGALKGMSGLL